MVRCAGAAHLIGDVRGRRAPQKMSPGWALVGPGGQMYPSLLSADARPLAYVGREREHQAIRVASDYKSSIRQ